MCRNTKTQSLKELTLNLTLSLTLIHKQIISVTTAGRKTTSYIQCDRLNQARATLSGYGPDSKS